MPTSATHITIVQRLASEAAYTNVLGDPDPTLPVTDPRAIRMRYAALGACGPDVLYALADYGGDLQDLENILVKTAGTFSALADQLAKIQEAIDNVAAQLTLGLSTSLAATSQMINSVMTEGLYALLAGGGVNPLAFFEPVRQRDGQLTGWYWADVLHYWRTGKFAGNLVRLAKDSGNPNLIAYAYGYLTHYVTDVVGHPYVNQITGGPWRLLWQRHHLVENFIDAYVWDRWHVTMPAVPGASEPPLDRLVSTPNSIGNGAPVTYARLNDHINIGATALPDPVDRLVRDVSDGLGSLLNNIGIAEATDLQPPDDPDFKAWTQLFVDAMHVTYDGFQPTNLRSDFILRGRTVQRADGFPVADDISAAYETFRLLLRITTEENVKDPQPLSISSDISAAIAKIGADIAANLGGIPGPPAIPNSAAFSLSALVDAIEKAFEWAAQVASAVTKAAFDFVNDTLGVATTVAVDSIKYALWLVSKALYALYRAFRDVLTLRAYAIPFRDQLETNIGALATSSLWQSMGNPTRPNPAAPPVYPHEELMEQAKRFASSYVPIEIPQTPAERPGFDFVAPYSSTTVRLPRVGMFTSPALPDAFIDEPRPGTPTNMFDPDTGPQATLRVNPRLDVLEGFAASPKDYGPAMDNCRTVINTAMSTGPLVLPDYNLDGDRTYGWPCWDVDPDPAGDPLNPANNLPSMIATVTAKGLV